MLKSRFSPFFVSLFFFSPCAATSLLLSHESIHLNQMESAKGKYVGELQEKWQFPSDHLPIAMSVDECQLLSWNVLDSDFMEWVIEKNSQGLSRSLIAKEHRYIERYRKNPKLTLRDQHIVQMIVQMIFNPHSPKDILALQETGEAFLQELTSQLPSQFKVISAHGNALVINQKQYKILVEDEIFSIFSAEAKRSLQDVTLQSISSNKKYRIINVHIPGDPMWPSKLEFCQYLARTFSFDTTTIATGDMNFNEIQMSQSLDQAFPSASGSPFTLYTPYCTNVEPYTFRSKAIDHFMVFSPENKKVILSAPRDIVDGLEEMVSLLESKMHILTN